MKITLSFLLLLFAIAGIAQPLEEKLVASLDSFALANPQEKVYLQTDRSRFIAGETVWYKAYYTLFEKPGVLSNVLYVTLSDDAGTVLQKQQLKLTRGTAGGEMELPATLQTGTYYLHAYTLWMKNFPEFTRPKKIVVYNTRKSITAAPAPRASAQLTLGFYPESGKLVAGLTANVAFNCLDKNNRALAVSGKVLDSKNNTVAVFKSVHKGMGAFSFTPLAGETYTAMLDNNVTSKRFALPTVMPEGIVLIVDNSNASKAFVKLERAEKNAAAYNNLVLVAQQNYQVTNMAKINFDEGQDAMAINKKNLLPGLLHITVFSQEGTVLATRVVFVANYVNPLTEAAAMSKTRRAKSSFSVDLRSFAEPDVAVAVINATADTTEQSTNILSQLLLESDLVSGTEDAAYYLRGKDSARLQHLDILLMINGWKRFNWPDILASRYTPLKYPFERGLSFSGKVLQSNGKSALNSGKINLLVKGEDSTTILSEAVVDANSSFVVGDLDFKKAATIFYQGTNTKNQNAIVSVKINDAHVDTLRKIIPPDEAGTPASQPLAYLQNLLNKKEREDDARSKLLQEVVLVSKKLSPVDSINRMYVSPIFEYSDQTLIMDDGKYFDIWQYLQRMVPGIAIDKTEATPRINFSRYEGLSFFSSDSPTSGVQLFLNEVPVSADIADNINPSDVSVIKVYKGVTGIALGASRGAIGIYTKKGVSTRDWRVKGFEFVKKAGYTAARPFFAMNYSILNPESTFTDVRPTLYWNPYVKVENGKAVIEYYNDDITSSVRVVLEGIDKNGKLISVEKVFD